MRIKIPLRCNVNLDGPMPDASDLIVLVTPVWNDSARLRGFGMELAAALAASPLQVRWVIADDGSEPAERVELAALLEDYSKVFSAVSLHHAGEHRGKGSIVREAWALFPDADWCAFIDADGSVAASDLFVLFNEALAFRMSVFGLRKRTATTRISMNAWRWLAHRGYRILVHAWLGLRCEDPQCGVKILRGDDYRRVAGGLRENGFAFDTELLLRLARAGCRWRELPVGWVGKKGGKVRPLRDAWAMLAALWRLR